MTVRPETHNRPAQVPSTKVPFGPACHFKFFSRHGPTPHFPTSRRNHLLNFPSQGHRNQSAVALRRPKPNSSARRLTRFPLGTLWSQEFGRLYLRTVAEGQHNLDDLSSKSLP